MSRFDLSKLDFKGYEVTHQNYQNIEHENEVFHGLTPDKEKCFIKVGRLGLPDLGERNSFETEMVFTKLLSDLEIAPKLLSSWTDEINNVGIMAIEAYNTTYGDYRDTHIYAEDEVLTEAEIEETKDFLIGFAQARKSLHDLINRFHDLGLVHGDLTSRNIVMKLKDDIPTGEVKLIDFETCYYFNSPPPGRMENICSQFSNPEEIFDYELNLLDMD